MKNVRVVSGIQFILIQKKKQRAQSKYELHPKATNWKKNVLLKNHCDKMCWNAQRQHIPKSDKYGDPVQVWKCLMSLGID